MTTSAWLTPRRLRLLWYAPLLASGMALMMLRLLVMAQLLELDAFADFSAGLLVSGTFCMLGCAGLQSLLQREWPVHLVRGRERRAMVLAAQCHLVAAGLALAGLTAAALGLVPAGMSGGLMAAGVLHGLAQQNFLVATTESRSRGELLRFSLQNLLRAVLVLAASAVVAWGTGSALATLLVDALLSAALAGRYWAVAAARTRFHLRAALAIGRHRLTAIDWRAAATLMFAMSVAFALLSLDRWIAAYRLGSTGFAHYSFAWIVLSVAQSAQAVVNASVYPLLARRYAQAGATRAFSVCCRVSGVVLLIAALGAWPVSSLITIGVERAYPQYREALELLPLFLAVVVLRMSEFWSSFLLITGRETLLLATQLCAASVVLLLWWLAIGRHGAIAARQVAWLCVALTTAAYLSALAAAWRMRRSSA